MLRKTARRGIGSRRRCGARRGRAIQSTLCARSSCEAGGRGVRSGMDLLASPSPSLDVQACFKAAIAEGANMKGAELTGADLDEMKTSDLLLDGAALSPFNSRIPKPPAASQAPSASAFCKSVFREAVQGEVEDILQAEDHRKELFQSMQQDLEEREERRRKMEDPDARQRPPS